MKQDKYREELFESLAIGIKKDFERANRKRAKSNESPLSFSEFADTFMEYRKAYKKKVSLISYVVVLILALVVCGVPKSVIELISYIIAAVIVFLLSYRSQKKRDKMFENSFIEIISVCKDKNIDIYNYIENEYWKK